MKKKLSYRDKLLELAYIYNVKEIFDIESMRNKSYKKTSTKKYKRLQSSIFIKNLTHKSKLLIT